LERLVVETICFDFHIWPPHQLLMKFVKKLKGDRTLALKAYNTLNDCYKTTICLRFPPHAIASASIFLAAKLLHMENFPESKGSLPWFSVFLCRKEDIEEICRLLLDHFIAETSSNQDDPMYQEYVRLRISLNSASTLQTQENSKATNGAEVVRPLIQPIEGEPKHYTIRYTFGSMSPQHKIIEETNGIK
ncbi:15529_t:CDS:2, partial [Acaulospora morrowiae]